jgi:hypothetical protein
MHRRLIGSFKWLDNWWLRAGVVAAVTAAAFINLRPTLKDGWADVERAAPRIVVTRVSPNFSASRDRQQAPGVTLDQLRNASTPAPEVASQQSQDQESEGVPAFILSHEVSAAWIICIIIMALHADQRFNTPLRHPSTTRRRLYQEALFAYITLTVSVFVVLTLALWPELAKERALSTVLIAALFLTDGIPHLPFLREIDLAILEFFKRAAKIPLEVQRWALR